MSICDILSKRNCSKNKLHSFVKENTASNWTVGVVMWSACLPSTLTIQVQIPLKPSVFSVNFLFENYENKQKMRPILLKKHHFNETFQNRKWTIRLKKENVIISSLRTNFSSKLKLD